MKRSKLPRRHKPLPKTVATFSAEPSAKAPPTDRITVVNDIYQPSAIAHTLTADKLMSIFRSAEAGNTSEYFALLRDVVISDGFIQTLIGTRKLCVLGNPISIPPRDKNSADDVNLAARCLEMIEVYDEQPPAVIDPTNKLEPITPWLNALAAMMDGHFWPVSVLEKIWRPSSRPGLRFELSRLQHVPSHLLDYSTGRLMILDTDKDGAIVGTKHEPDPDRYIIHRGHLLSLPDNWGGPMRSILAWWLLMNMGRTWWATFLNKYGSPFPVGKFDPGDDESRRILQGAFALAVRLGGLVISKNSEVELMQAAASASGDAFKVFRDVGRKEIAQTILGQTATSDAEQGGGMNSGVGGAQMKVLEAFTLWDEHAVARTLKTQLFAQFSRINGLSGAIGTPSFGIITADQQEALGKMLKSFKDAGLEPTDDALASISEQSGIALQRSGSPAAPLPIFHPRLFTVSNLAEADQAVVDLEARGRSADLAQAFRGSLAPVRQMVLDSTSREDLERRIKLHYADWTPARLAAIIEEAIGVLAARGAVAASQN
ncbi:MAG: DUF935 family protein [Verrucomicrobia bacterium]|nr:DUF935 family protein [Verrucomicrobiota bacterium]